MEQITATYTKLERFVRRHPLRTTAIFLLFIALLAFTRRPEMFLAAQFWAEDGAIWYIDAYHNGFWSTIFKPYPEYLAVPQRFFAFISTLFPLAWAPLFLNIVGLGFQLITVFLLISGRLDKLVPSRVAALALAIVFIALPNTTEVFASFANAQWHLGLAALLVVIAPPPKGRWWRVADIAILVASGLSGPLTIFLVPIAVLRWWFGKRARHYAINIAVVGCVALVQLLTIALSEHFRQGNPPDANLLALIKMIAGQIFTGGLLGHAYITLFYEQRFWLCATLFAGLALIAYAVWRGPIWLKLMNLYPPLVVGGMLATAKNDVVATMDIWHGLTNPTGGQRYWYIPIAVWVTTIMWLAWRARSRFVKGVSFGLIYLLAAGGIMSGWYLSVPPDNKFKEHAQQFEQAPRGKPFTFPINPPGWKVILYKK